MRKLLLACFALIATLHAAAQAPNTISGLRLWLDASDVNGNGSAPANGSAVTTWMDKSGNGFNAVTVGTTNPVYNAAAIGSAGTIGFNRTNSVVAGFNVPGLDIRAGSMEDVTIFTVYRQGSTAGLGQQAVWGIDNGGWDRFFFSQLNGNDGAVSRGQTVSPFAVDVTGAGTPGLVRLLTTVYDGDVSGGPNSGPANGTAVYFNGQLVATTTDYTDASNAQSSFKIGFDGDDNYFQGEIAEVVVYNRKLTGCEIQVVNEYLASKYGQPFSTPSISAGGPTTFCSGGSVVLSSSIVSGNQWQEFSGGGWNNIAGQTGATYTATSAGQYRSIVCGSKITNAITVTVNPQPSATIDYGAPAFCRSGTAPVQLTGTAGGTFTATAGLSINSSTGLVNLATSVAGNHTVSYTIAASGSCSEIIATNTFTVNPTPNVTPVAAQTFCTGTNTSTIALTGSVGGTVYNWNNSNAAFGLAGSGSGDIAGFAAVNNGTLPVSGTVTVIPSYTNGGVTCSGAQATFLVTINPRPIGSASLPSQTVCHNAASQVINFSTTANGGTTTYTWTNNTTSIGLGASGNGSSIASFNAVNSGAAPVTGTITTIPTFTNNSVACVGNSFASTVTVNPRPTGSTTSASQTVCHNTATSAITFSTTATGGTTAYAWTNNAASIGLAAAGNGNIASFNAQNNGTAPVSATVSVTPTFTNNSVGCAGTPFTALIVVNQRPVASIAPAALTLCHNAASGGINFSTTSTGGTTTYAWTNNTPSVGLGANGNGDIASFTANNTGTAPVVATITATPTFTNNSVGCAGAAVTQTITVNPRPVGSATPASQVICHNSPTQSIAFSTTATGGTTAYTWINSNSAIGLAAGGSGSISSFSASNPGTAPALATVTITPTFTNNSVSCAGNTFTAAFTINPRPTGTAAPVTQTVCHNSPTTAIAFSTTATGGTTTYAWTNATVSIGLPASGNGNIASFLAANTGTAPVTATIPAIPTYTNASVACDGAPFNTTIIVNPRPVAAATPATQTICNGAPTQAITFNTTATGGTTTYAWTNGNTTVGLPGAGTGDIPSFTAQNTGTAPESPLLTVTPTFTNNAVSCAGTAITPVIIINPTPVAAATNLPQSLCATSNSQSIAFSTTATGGTITYAWTNTNPLIGLSASGAGNGIASFAGTNTTNAPINGTLALTPTFTNAGTSCVGNTLSAIITINPKPTISAKSLTRCSDLAFAITPVNGIGGDIVPVNTSYTWTTPVISPNTADVTVTAGGTGSAVLNTVTVTLKNNTTAPMRFPTATLTVVPQAPAGVGGCIGNPFTIVDTVNPVPQAPQVTISPATTLCQFTRNQNFQAQAGTIASPGAAFTGIGFKWTVSNGNEVNAQWTTNGISPAANVATGNALLSFITAGNATVTITDSIVWNNVRCANTSSFPATPATYTITPGADNLKATVIHTGQDFVCLLNSVGGSPIDSYQWGYDAKPGLAATKLDNEVMQYYRNPNLDTAVRAYWVITKEGSCFTKNYYNRPFILRTRPAVDPVADLLELKVAPNPVSSTLNLLLDGPLLQGNFNVQVADMGGRILLRRMMTAGNGSTRATIDVQALPAGTYLLTVSAPGRPQWTSRFVKQ